MMRNKLAKKLTAMIMTGTMVMSMSMTAFAAEGTLNPGDEKQFTVIKKVTTDVNNKTYAPNETFSFKIEAGAAEDSLTYKAEEGQAVVHDIKKGLETEDGTVLGLSIVGTAEFNSDMEYTNGIFINSNVKVKIDETAFAGVEPGVYHYVLSEKIPVDSDKYPGVTYDASKYHIYVFALEESSGRTYTYIAYKEAADGVKETTKTDELSFTNDYGADTTEDSTHDVTITKKLSGNQASAGDDFEFKITIAPDHVGEKFNVEYSETSNGAVTSATIDTATDPKGTYTIKGSGYIKITGLTNGDKITVDEGDYSGKGYTTTYSVADGSENNVNGFKVTSVEDKADYAEFWVTGDGAQIEVTNARDAITPTGIAMTFAPYAVMVAFAGVFAVMFLRKKREDF